MKGKKRIRTGECVQTCRAYTRREKGGINWFLYRKYILIPHLYRFYEEVQAANPGTNIWLIEDNAPSHLKSAQVCKKDREERRIRKIDWSANFPDLHPIEEVWFYTDAALEPQWCEIRGVGKEAQNQARKAITEVCESENIKQDTEGICNCWKVKLQLCYDRNSNNKFRG